MKFAGMDLREGGEIGKDGGAVPAPPYRPRGSAEAMPTKTKKCLSCDECYFRKNMLCALELEDPCATFRPNRPEGLVPPRQPVLLMRPPRWAAQSQSA